MDVRLVADRYRLEHELGRGGMGTVWLGEDQLAGRQVAVKELRPPRGLTGSDQETFTKRALAEARSAARIHHTNAVTLFDVIPATADDDAVYLIMEYVHGRTLAELITDRGALSDEYAKAVGLQLLSILDTAHSMGVVHRDIKPANIMITASGDAKLTDFGIAYSMGETRMTRSGVMGTQAYMAPELFESAPITPAVDLWSLGATLYYAVEGRGPFDRDNTAATLHAILVEELPAPSCAPDLAAAIGGMLTRDHTLRFTSSQARAALLGQAVPQVPPGATSARSAAVPPPPAFPPPAVPAAPAPGAPAQPAFGDATSAFGPSSTSLQRENKPAPPAVETPRTSLPGQPVPLGTRRAAAAALLGLGAVFGLVSLFLPVYGKTTLAADSRWLWPYLPYAVSWIAATAWMLIAKARARPAALFGLALGVPAIGLALQNLAEITRLYPTPGSGFTIGLVGVLVGIAGAICALTVPRGAAPDGASGTAVWRKVLAPSVGLAAVVVYSAFPTIQYIASPFQAFGQSTWEGPGILIPLAVFAAIAVGSAWLRTAQERAALFSGAAVYLLAAALQGVVTLAQFQFKSSFTLFFWLFVVLAVAAALTCWWTVRPPREPV